MKLLFPGSFDPFTVGHADIVKRAVAMGFDVVIAVGVNSGKQPMYSSTRRIDAISAYYSGDSRVKVVGYSGLTVDAVRDNGCDAILRGVRSVTDFDMERNLADINRSVSGTETLLIVSDPSVQHISSSMVRELMSFGHKIDDLVIDTFSGLDHKVKE